MVHHVEIEQIKTPKDFLSFLNDHDVQRNDTLKIMSVYQGAIIGLALFTIAAALGYYKIKKHPESNGEQILENIFQDKSLAQIEQEIEADYGIKIETEYIDQERDEWLTISHEKFVSSYENEPDYDFVSIREPNPEYKAWKGK